MRRRGQRGDREKEKKCHRPRASSCCKNSKMDGCGRQATRINDHMPRHESISFYCFAVVLAS